MSVEEEKKEAAPTATATTTTEWILWKHICGKRAKSEVQWKKNTCEIAHLFAHHASITDQPFDIDLHHLPMPSKTFFLKTTQIHEEHKAPLKHTEYSLFKKGVFPDWEDSNCQGELYTKHYFPPELLDQYWQQLVQGVMNGTVDDAHMSGIRIVDKSNGKHPVYKMELWLDTADPNARGTIREQAMDCIKQDEHYRFKLHWREFSHENRSEEGTDSMAPSEISEK
jgi:hypothetical protein